MSLKSNTALEGDAQGSSGTSIAGSLEEETRLASAFRAQKIDLVLALSSPVMDRQRIL